MCPRWHPFRQSRNRLGQALGIGELTRRHACSGSSLLRLYSQRTAPGSPGSSRKKRLLGKLFGVTCNIMQKGSAWRRVERVNQLERQLDLCLLYFIPAQGAAGSSLEKAENVSKPTLTRVGYEQRVRRRGDGIMYTLCMAWFVILCQLAMCKQKTCCLGEVCQKVKNT